MPRPVRALSLSQVFLPKPWALPYSGWRAPAATLQPSRVIGRLAVASERPKGAAAVLAMAALLAALPGHNTIDMGGWLDGLGRHLDATFHWPGGPSLSCSAAAQLLPMRQAFTLGLITDLLVSNAYLHGFLRGKAGRIAVSSPLLEEQRIAIEPPSRGFRPVR